MQWISVEDKLPESNEMVYVAAIYKQSKKPVEFVGYWLNRWSEESHTEGEWDGFAEEYSEEKDLYFYKEGWYERLLNWDEYSSLYAVEVDVTHWMPLPKPPEGY